MRKMENIIIWGVGKIGSSKYTVELLEEKYHIVGYSDNNRKAIGEIVNGYTVFSIEEVKQLYENGKIDMILVTVSQMDVYLEIRNQIRDTIADVKVCHYDDECDALENAYIEKIKDSICFDAYKVVYKDYVEKWIENLLEEVQFWVEKVAKNGAIYNDTYYSRLNNTLFNANHDANLTELEKYLEKLDNPKVLDVGCGLAPLFGEVLENGKKLDLVGVDPLAFFYNEINRFYAPDINYTIEFGMFEFLSEVFKENYYDAIIINNALDHCIDPYLSIIKALKVLKIGGILRLNHFRAEGVKAKYEGLHQWNMDYNKSDDFIIWNYDMGINISDKLKDVAEIVVKHNDEVCRKKQYISVDIIKRRNIDVDDYINSQEEKEDLMQVIRYLMKAYSDASNNMTFLKMMKD